MDDITIEMMQNITRRLNDIERKIGFAGNATESISERLNWIENQLNIKTELNQIWDKRLRILEKHDSKIQKILKGMVSYLEHHITKLTEVYYNTFPDRLFQDEKVADQLKKILKDWPGDESGPDADPAQS